jgi:hypothetical protein
MHDTLTPGFTVADIAARYRVGPDKVRAWIKAGELTAINTSAAICARPRFVVTAEALARFEKRRSVTLPPKPKRRRRAEIKDYYPND